MLGFNFGFLVFSSSTYEQLWNPTVVHGSENTHVCRTVAPSCLCVNRYTSHTPNWVRLAKCSLHLLQMILWYDCSLEMFPSPNLYFRFRLPIPPFTDRGFTAAQFAATAACSIAVALLTLAVFRPAVAGCASVKSLARAGGVILIVYAIFQLGAAVLAHFLAKEFERVCEYNNQFLVCLLSCYMSRVGSPV